MFLSLYSFQIGVRASINFHDVTDIDVKWNVDRRAGLELRRLCAAATDRVTSKARIGLRDFQFHEVGNFVSKDFVARPMACVFLVLFQILALFSELRILDRYLLLPV